MNNNETTKTKNTRQNKTPGEPKKSRSRTKQRWPEDPTIKLLEALLEDYVAGR